MRSLRLALIASALITTRLMAGPPWISVEYPVNPFDDATRGALLVVHTYHHGIPMQFPVRAYAESIINGRHHRIPLQTVATSKTGISAVRGELPRTGTWVVRVDMTDTETKTMASALVSFSNGEVASVKVPSQVRNGWVVPTAATQADVDRLLARK